MKVIRRLLPALFCAGLTLSAAAFAAEKPLWELGVGAGLLLMPDYRGSDQTRAYVLPFPYVIYRGDVLKIQDRRISGKLLATDRVVLDFSVYGAVPVKSDNNEARTGMPNLDPTFELGPAVKIVLFESQEEKFKLNLSVPVRALFSTDFRSVRHEGWVFNPRLNLQKRDLISVTGLNLGVSAGPIFADKGYHEYFYAVESAYARTARPMYSAASGYSGSALTVGLGKSYKNFIFHAFVSADFLQGAAFEESPLVKTKTSIMSGFTVSWVFLQSAKTAPVKVDD